MTDLEQRVTDLEDKLEKLMLWTTSKLKESPTKYTEDEEQRLLLACEGTEHTKGETAKMCVQLIEDGWNDNFNRKRTFSALRTKYLRMKGLK
jgi:hypothetical protein